MKITQENIDNLNAILKVSVVKDDYAPKLDTMLGNYRKKVDLKGFRKGQVPKSIVKKMYGNQALSETINDLLSNSLNDYIIENKIDILGHPIPKRDQMLDVDINDMKDFDFEYEIGLAPEFKVDLLEKKSKIEMETIEPTEKMLDEEVDRIKKRFGEAEEVEKIEAEDVVNIKMEALDESGNHAHTSITPEMVKDEANKKKFSKLKKGDTLEVNPYEFIDKPEAEVSKHILNQEGLLAENAPKYKLTVESIKRVKPAEINQELLDNMYGKDVLKTEEEMRAKIKEDVQQYFDKQADAKLYNNLAEKLINETKIDLPDEFLKRWIKMTNEKPISDEQIENDYEGFRKNLIWSLLVKKIGKENNIEVSDQEVKARTAEQIQQQMLSYGIPEVSEEQTEKFVAGMMARKDHVDKTKETLLEEKLFETLKGKLDIKEKKVSLEEFNQQVK